MKPNYDSAAAAAALKSIRHTLEGIGKPDQFSAVPGIPEHIITCEDASADIQHTIQRVPAVIRELDCACDDMDQDWEHETTTWTFGPYKLTCNAGEWSVE